MGEWGDKNGAHTVMGWVGEKPGCRNVSDEAFMCVALVDSAQLWVRAVREMQEPIPIACGSFSEEM